MKLALIKSIIPIWTLACAVVVGGAFAIFTVPNVDEVEKVVEYMGTVNTPDVVKWENNYVILEEKALSKGINTQYKEGIKVKCQIEGETKIEICLLAKVKEVAGRSNKWISLKELQAITYDTYVSSDYITDSKTIYKVGVTSGLIDEWIKDQSKKLHIWPESHLVTDETSKPLTSLVVSTSIKATDKFTGKTEYLVGNVLSVTNTLSDGVQAIRTPGKWFKCALPSTSDVFKNCDIYYFDEEDSKNKNFINKQITTPLTKALTVNNKIHYILKFEEELNINSIQYPSTTYIKLKIYTDETRSTEVTTGITDMTFNFLSHTVLFMKGDWLELALIL